MGLIDFVRSAGRILSGPAAAVSAAIEDATKAHANPPPAPTPDAVQKELKRVGLPEDKVKVVVDGETVHITGKVADAATKEKLILAAGNIVGVGKVNEDIQTEADAPQSQFYTVQAGDNLSKIAQKYYGSANKYPVIFEANKPMLTDPDKIYPGQVLRIPQ